jgi:hypothetical protein
LKFFIFCEFDEKRLKLPKFLGYLFHRKSHVDKFDKIWVWATLLAIFLQKHLVALLRVFPESKFPFLFPHGVERKSRMKRALKQGDLTSW